MSRTFICRQCTPPCKLTTNEDAVDNPAYCPWYTSFQVPSWKEVKA